MKPCNCTIDKTKPSVVNRQVPKNKNSKELVRWLSGKACTALAEDQILVPSTHVRKMSGSSLCLWLQLQDINAFFRPPPRHLHSLHIDIHIIFKWLFIHSFYGLRQTKHSMCTDMLNILCRWTSCSLWSHGKHSWEKITNYGKCLAVEKAAAGASSEQNYNRKSVPAYSAVFHYVVTSCLQNELERCPN